ncbi:MAG: GNAT family N-acetyltransferase [Marinicella sp.]
MEFIIDDLTHPKVIGLLEHHIEQMIKTSPPESRHVLDIEQLKSPDITFWSLWKHQQELGQQLLGCVALKRLSKEAGEIKSMKVSPDHTRQGIGKNLLFHVIQEAQNRRFKKLFLETGSMAYFAPARKLYETNGFTYCEPFADYTKDDNNVFMCKDVTQ